MNIPFYKPYLIGMESSFINEVLQIESFAGNGVFTKKCHTLLKNKYGFKHCFLTHSCSSALEMAALLCQLKEEDEVIVPSFSYTTTVSAFLKPGIRIRFADSSENSPHLSVDSIRKLINSRTKVIVVIHYGGSGYQIDAISQLANEHSIILVEDAAYAINSKYGNQYLGSFGHVSTFSFHQSKNIHSGEGGILVLNDENLLDKTLETWQEGTNKHRFDSGEINAYTWVSKGSSFQPSEVTSAFLYAQLKSIDSISDKRISQWNYYFEKLYPLAANNSLMLPEKNDNGHNGHIFYLKLGSEETRNDLLQILKGHKIYATFHYQPLHLSPFWLKNNSKITIPHAEKWSRQILRLPLYHTLSHQEQDMIIEMVFNFFSKRFSTVHKLG